MRRASSAFQCKLSTFVWISPFDSANGFPCSKVIISANLSAFSSIKSAARCRILTRSRNCIPDHTGKACLAASIARSKAALSPFDTSVKVSPVAGLITGRIPFDPFSHFPFINKSVCISGNVCLFVVILLPPVFSLSLLT